MSGRVGAFAEVDAGFEFCQRGGEIEVGGGVVDWVGRGGDDQCVDCARIDVLLEIGEGTFAGGFRLQGKKRFAFADVAESEVDREGEVVDSGRLAGSAAPSIVIVASCGPAKKLIVFTPLSRAGSGRCEC